MFREYDIRGLVDRDLNEAVFTALGQGFARFLQGAVGSHPRVVVGRDVRPSSGRYAAALIAGLCAQGCEVFDLGEVPTPLVAFAVRHLTAHGGLAVTASHNPPEFNGLKLRKWLGAQSEPLTGAEVQQLRELSLREVHAPGGGNVQPYDIIPPYLAYLRQTIRFARPLTVVVDSGNGVAGPTALAALRQLGAGPIGLHTEPDGTFPHHLPNPSDAANLVDLCQAVPAHGAEVGIALDGDGDRLGVVDDRGQILWPDQYLVFLARQALAQRPSPIVFDVKCSVVLSEEIRRAGGTPVMTRTGYPNLVRAQREHGAALAGEFSGHVIFADPVIDFDDGTYAAVRFLQWLAEQARPLSVLMAELPQMVATPEERYPCPDDRKFAIVAALRQQFAAHYETITIDGVRVVFPDGWALIRASNTEPALTARYEATTPERLQAIVTLVKASLRAYPEIRLDHS
ncbi:MAG: phosphomannomutase/phosphoglucomutase [Chloroflexi bacterium]|nr:phosphomannomutase/phosphoglucomutase [Chloroflexota bacterium]